MASVVLHLLRACGEGDREPARPCLSKEVKLSQGQSSPVVVFDLNRAARIEKKLSVQQTPGSLSSSFRMVKNSMVTVRVIDADVQDHDRLKLAGAGEGQIMGGMAQGLSSLS